MTRKTIGSKSVGTESNRGKMSAEPEIAVTGVTGALGGRVTRMLEDAGVPFRPVVRSADKAAGFGEAARAAEYGDSSAVREALEGISAVLMVSASESADRRAEHRSFIDGAVAAGVGQIIYTSFLGAAEDCTFTLGRDHWATEQYIRESGAAFTFLRDNFYLDFLPKMAGKDGVIRGPAGDGRVSAVTRHDIARVAAAVLGEPSAHAGRSYDLTGPESLSLEEVAAAITEKGDRRVRFHDETIEEAYESRSPYGAPDWQVDAWVSTYTAIAAGEVAEVSGAVEDVTGTPPLSLGAYLENPV